MKILVVHNFYRQPGGEDVVFEAERALLERYGHEVVTFIEDNAQLDSVSPMRVAAETVWSRKAQGRIRKLIQEMKPDVAHFHNTFLRISPAAYYACKEMGVPVVQTLHNYRLLCPAATFFRSGQVCEDCLGKALTWPSILHGCWRNSRVQTAVVATMLTLHRWLKTWQKQVDVYIALTEFARQKFIEGGLTAEKIVVKPNFVHPDLGVREGLGQYALFVGRLSPEKGIRTLLQAWQKKLKDIPLKIAGGGPLLNEVQISIQTKALKDVEALGQRAHAEVIALIQGAHFLIVPSECYEAFPLIIVEAFACGVPVIASRLGAMVEIVEDRRTGLHFTPGDADDLAAKVEWAWTHPREMAEMGREARREYEATYTAERNYEMLMGIYKRALGKAAG
jgi:glycosyltransferase involved in cell wall biosynthesis